MFYKIYKYFKRKGKCILRLGCITRNGIEICIDCGDSTEHLPNDWA